MAVVSTKSDTAIDICNRGLIFIGAEPITSFDDGTTEARVAANIYEDVVQTSLTNARWRFATNQEALNRLTDAPTARFDLAYQQPNDTLIVHAITVNDNPIEYQIYGDMIYADTTTTDTVVADYTFRQTEEFFPSYFVMAVAYGLAQVFATSIARDGSLTQTMATLADAAMRKARSVDSQQQTSRKLITGRFVQNRR
jgi:hypothetical protein|tara:strand:+ start:164 stop:754 length:591 start_codon:yes stop_codon:yes gene_type:complete